MKNKKKGSRIRLVNGSVLRKEQATVSALWAGNYTKADFYQDLSAIFMMRVTSAQLA